MKRLFDEAIFFTDIHYGLKRNSVEHNKDCNDFIRWMIEQAKERGIKTCFFLGDWHHNRHTLNIETLKYSWEGLKLLDEYFEKVYFIVGNHDLYYRDNREVHSLLFTDKLHNFVLIEEEFTEGDVTIYPWLVGNEWKKAKNCKSKYIFGHFELPTFYLNAMVKMPDNNELKADHFTNQKFVFTGHFHKRQREGNVMYIGNAFPHDFNDLNDDERGCMILKWDEEPEFYAWPDAPKYRHYTYDALVGNEDQLINMSKVHLKLEYNDNSVSNIKISSYRDEIIEKYNLRSCRLIESHKQELFEGEEIEDAVACDNVDNIVINQIKTIESEEYDNNRLIRIYGEL